MERRKSTEITHAPNNALKDVLQHRKRNETFRQLFRLPDGEEVIDEINVCYMCHMDPDNKTKLSAAALVRKNMYPGKLYQSQNFLAFQSGDVASMTEPGKSHYSFILPLYTITRFERINGDHHRSALSFKTWHKMLHYLQVDVSKLLLEWYYKLTCIIGRENIM